MEIPIINPDAVTVPPQLRLNVRENVGEMLADQKRIGLRFGRAILDTPVNSSDLKLLLWFEELEKAGATIVAVAEHPIVLPGRQAKLQVHVLFRCPESLFAGLDS